MSQLSEYHKVLTNGVGKCSVPMWSRGCPDGFCDEPAYGFEEKEGRLSLTKEEVSDIKSLISRVEECTLKTQEANWNLVDARKKLESWLVIHTGAASPLA